MCFHRRFLSINPFTDRAEFSSIFTFLFNKLIQSLAHGTQTELFDTNLTQRNPHTFGRVVHSNRLLAGCYFAFEKQIHRRDFHTGIKVNVRATHHETLADDL